MPISRIKPQTQVLLLMLTKTQSDSVTFFVTFLFLRAVSMIDHDYYYL